MGVVSRDVLNEKQKRFVEAYTGPAEGNATKAARMAEYAHPDTQGPRLLEHVGVREAILAARKPRSLRAILTRERRQELLSNIAEDDGNEETKDRIKAIEVLGKMQGDFIERHEFEMKAAGALDDKLKGLEGKMPPEAYEALLEALASDT